MSLMASVTTFDIAFILKQEELLKKGDSLKSSQYCQYRTPGIMSPII